MGRWLPVWALLVTTSAVSLMAAQPPIKRLDGSTITPAEIDATVTRLMQAAEVPGLGIAIPIFVPPFFDPVSTLTRPVCAVRVAASQIVWNASL